ncbi:sacsin N-terminal ATP-binding-like domain-containing protein [Phytoactinopolyspora alkaliphila]|uniref:sacsin N-terminal ATP-binding-like domain-containing protein n=1 Tax=Phytoactinopolyspora alkaliphila TaxID=1783498 RepID=UPI001C2093A7|nr:hypothetical protein [Phytoactinopolyspora alkaliphila]
MDTLGTAALRDRVLAAWTASPARFREDANAEEELSLGAYRDRLVVELAQNAADAAGRAGVRGRLLLRLDGSTLIAANIGAPLDPEGVEGLSTLRSSPKRSGDSVGRFGVGFAAVLAVSDEPAVLSRNGGVRWSRARARDLIAQLPELSAELTHRGDAVPVLRLPFSAEDLSGSERSGSAAGPLLPAGAATAVPAGYETAVVLPLRDEDALASVRQALATIDDVLPLVLPALAEIVVETGGDRRVITAGEPVAVDEASGVWEREIGTRRWRLASATGTAEAGLLAGRPLEERLRPQWSVTVAVPVDEAGTPGTTQVHPVVHAPTPTDDTTTLPALVIGSFPLDSTRRHVTASPLTEHLAERVGAAYARLVASFDTPLALTLIPGPLGANELDATLHRWIHDALTRTPFIPSATGDARLRPTEVNVVDGLDRAAGLATLADVVAGLPAPGWWRTDALQRLGAKVTPLTDLVDQLSALTLSPDQWRAMYAALDGAELEALGALPVPLADGRVVRGPRSVLLPGDLEPALLAPFRLRVTHPDAAHPLLGRLGATEVTAASVLRDPAVRAGIEAAGDDEAEALPEAVLRLVAESGLTVADEPWLDQLPLPDEAGEFGPARELLLPGSELLDLLDVDVASYTASGELLARHGAQTLRAVGVRDGLALARESDVPLDDDLWFDLDDEEGWADHATDLLPDTDLPPLVAEFVAVRDLDLVRDDAWPRFLALLAADPAIRPAVVEPAFVFMADGSRRRIPSYTTWWLRTHARVGGLPLPELCADDADPVVQALLQRLDVPVDDAFRVALGISRSVEEVPTAVLLRRLADDDVRLPSADLLEVYAELSQRPAEPLGAPGRVRIPDGRGSRVVDADQAVVCDGPHWLQLGLPAAVPGSPELAASLDVDLASDAYDADVAGGGEHLPVPQVAYQVLPSAATSYVEHDELVVAGLPVDWWVVGDEIHAATLDGLARGLAWVAGEWDRRWVLAEALQDPAALPTLLAEETFG